MVRLYTEEQKEFYRWNQRAKKLSGEDWLKLIETNIQSQPLRKKVGRIIWWDYLSITKKSTALNPLIKQVGNPLELPESEVIRALEALGYPKSHAYTRVHQQKQKAKKLGK